MKFLMLSTKLNHLICILVAFSARNAAHILLSRQQCQVGLPVVYELSSLTVHLVSSETLQIKGLF